MTRVNTDKHIPNVSAREELLLSTADWLDEQPYTEVTIDDVQIALNERQYKAESLLRLAAHYQEQADIHKKKDQSRLLYKTKARRELLSLARRYRKEAQSPQRSAAVWLAMRSAMQQHEVRRFGDLSKAARQAILKDR
jgi:hypothetical protein